MNSGNYFSPVRLIVQISLVSLAWGLSCYDCESTEDPDCGYYFRDVFEVKECGVNETTCALQRQDPDEKYGQVFAILRGCYKPGLLPGLNSSIGCRYWYNDRERYNALYCFCDTDGCNGATAFIIQPLLVLLCLTLSVFSRLH